MSLRFLIAACIVLLGLGCKRAPATAATSIAYPDDPNIHYIGWFDNRVRRAPRFAWPGTQIAAQFTGTSLQVRLTDTPVEDDTRETDWITVVIDDQQPKTLALKEGLHVYRLAKGLPNRSHRVLIWKRTEAEVSVITFHGFVLDHGASLTRVTNMTQRRMVFIGDSITAGYGNEGPDPSCHWSAARENNYETYGAHAARELNAEYVATAWSGKGLTRNYEKRDELTLPDVYERVIPTETDSPRVPTTRADVVVVNIGTNDFFQGVPDEATFTSAYRGLLEALRGRYPDALFVLGVGPMLADDYPQPQALTLMRRWIQSVRSARIAAGDTKIEFMELWIDPAEGVGCDFHPNVKTHARLGRELTELVRTRLSW